MLRFLTNKWVHIGVLVLLLGLAVFYSGSNHEIRKRLQFATFDTYNRLHPRPTLDKVSIIDIDEESLVKLGQFPWPRNVMADLVTNLKEMGAKVIAFDVVFAESDRTSPEHIANNLPDVENIESIKEELKKLPNNDKVFSDSIRDAGNVVTGFTRARPEESLRMPYQNSKPTFLMRNKDDFFKHTFTAPGVATNLPEFSSVAAGNGSFMATPDVDGIIRQVSLFNVYPPPNEKGVKSNLFPMLGLEALRVYINAKARFLIKSRKDKGNLDTNYVTRIANFEIPIESDSKLWVYYRDIKDEEYISAHEIINKTASPDIQEKIKDKIIFIGTSAEGLRDIRSTPLDIFVPGVEVHVNVVEQILQGKYLKRPDIIIGVEATIIGVVGLLIILLAPFINVIWLGVFTIILMGGMFYGSYQAYILEGLLIDPVYPSAVLSILFLVSSLLSYARSEVDRRQVRDAFGHYISPEFMEELTKSPELLKLGGDTRELTVMFTDIRSFTKISEKLTPEELIQLMNDFLTPMSDLVMESRGTIDKYMGDAMMAFWNAPLDDPNHARHACLTALKMNEALKPVNEALQKRGDEEGTEPLYLNAGIGVNTGQCSVGNMGSKQRFAYSALGDSVNLASRLEGQTKAYGLNILIGEETAKQVDDLALLEVDLIQVVGREEPVRVYTLVGDAEFARMQEFKAWQAAHNGMLAAYRILDLSCAAQDCKEAKEKAGEQLQAFYDIYQARIAEFTKNPPPNDWGGVYVAKSK
ncbi:MAG: adenylate/guanylate cyclase domain-containing protein [Alphaproteobacteria bacterium]|nr:adenylate/guanylate cyclase domain-containing protein [Alphaproteobacteria bacterium]